MSEYTLDVASLATLEKQWQRSMRFGVLMAPLHPAPSAGDAVQVRMRLLWEGVAVVIRGQVVQVSEANTVVELSPLTEEGRDTLVKAGLGAAAQAPVAPKSAPSPKPAAPAPKSAPPPKPAAPPPRPAAPPQAPPQPSRPAAPPQARAPGPPGRPPGPPGGFRPKPAAFSPRPVKPGSAPGGGFRPPPRQPRPAGQAPPRPTAAPAAPPSTAREDVDINRVAGAEGPATLSSETLLPPAAQHGDFSRVSWRDALLHFFETKATGVLAIEAFREIRWCYLVEGKPVHFLGDKPHPGEFLSDALTAEGVIDLSKWMDALRVQKVTGKLAGEYLVAAGAFDRATLDRALLRRAERITRNLMGMNFGTFRFHDFPQVREVYTHQPVEVLEVLLAYQRESLQAVDDDRLVQKVEGFYPLHVRLVDARKNLLPQLPLADDEATVVRDLLPACWTLGELVGLKEMEERRLVRLLFALKALGMVEFVREEGANSRRNRAERILYSGLKDLTRRNDFEALHAHWSSSEQEIQAGYERVLQEFGRDRWRAVLDDRIEELIRMIRERAEQIWTRLGSRTGRKEARKKVVGDDQLRMASDLLDKQGEMASFKGDFRIVRACYERVLELDPGGSEGVENLKRAKQWLADPRVSGAHLGDMSDIQEKLDGLL